MKPTKTNITFVKEISQYKINVILKNKPKKRTMERFH